MKPSGRNPWKPAPAGPPAGFGSLTSIQNPWSVSSSSLLTLTDTAIYIKAAYFAAIISIMVWGILTLAMQNCHNTFWNNIKSKISLILNIAAVLLFVISLQPYAAVFVFVFLVIKEMMLIKKP